VFSNEGGEINEFYNVRTYFNVSHSNTEHIGWPISCCKLERTNDISYSLGYHSAKIDCIFEKLVFRIFCKDKIFSAGVFNIGKEFVM